MSDSDWAGGYFEIDMYLGEISLNAARDFAARLWQYPLLVGPYDEETLDKAAPLRFSEDQARGYGRAIFAEQGNVVCVHSIFRYLDDPNWITWVGFPMVSLGKLFPVGAYPFDDGTPTDWTVPVSEWLVDLARFAFEGLQFEMAVIGFEPSPPEDSFLPEIPSEERWDGYLKRIGPELVWFPPTINRAPMTIGW